METSRRSVGTTLYRGLTACYACLQHNTTLKQSSTPVDACTCFQPTQKKKGKYCLFEGCESEEKLGVIGQLFIKLFASKEFQWMVLDVFKEEQFDFKFGQRCAENFIENRTVVLLFGVSPPLVVATENYDM